MAPLAAAGSEPGSEPGPAAGPRGCVSAASMSGCDSRSSSGGAACVV